MNARSIQILRKKFIALFMVVIILVMIFLGSLINLSNYATSQQLIRRVLHYITENQGTLPDAMDQDEAYRESLMNLFSSEFQYSARYFSVHLNADGTVSATNIGRIAKIDEARASDLADQVVNRWRNFGRIGSYYYEKSQPADGGTLIVFLDCTTQINTISRIIFLTIVLCAVGLLLTWLLLRRFSDLLIRPELESMHRQKQFITNASHELKTPVAVIRANTELEEMINGENEWTKSTMRQVDRLNGLIQNLVMIARSQEAENTTGLSEIDLSETIRASVDPFSSLALQEEKTLECQLTPDIRILAEASLVQQLVSLLVDNAIKYCDKKGIIRIVLAPCTITRGLTRRKENVLRFSVSNSYQDGEHVDCSKFFDRFYREDTSHNADRGGYGIGLSVAESIVDQFGGSIHAEWKEGMISFICDFPTDRPM